MLRKIAMVAFGVAVSLLVAVVAPAATIGFAPGDITAPTGETVTVDIVISDLAGEIVSAYDLDVLYDSSVVSATGVYFTDMLGNPLLFEALQDADLSALGVVDLAELSLLSDAALLALQGDSSVTVATLEFEALELGTSPLSFVFDDFNQVNGLGGRSLDLNVLGGSVAVVIPEPTPALLLALGALGIGLFERRKKS